VRIQPTFVQVVVQKDVKCFAFAQLTSIAGDSPLLFAF
jgi:hypothetical protein